MTFGSAGKMIWLGSRPRASSWRRRRRTDERRPRGARSRPSRPHRRLRRQGSVRRRRHSRGQHADLRGAERRRSGRRRAAAARHLHDDGFLQGPRPLVRPTLLPLQLGRRPRADLGRVRGAADRRRSAALGGLGILRPRLPARGDREPVRVHDGQGTLRGVARRDEGRRAGRRSTRRRRCPIGTAVIGANARRRRRGTTAPSCRSRRISRC